MTAQQTSTPSRLEQTIAIGEAARAELETKGIPDPHLNFSRCAGENIVLLQNHESGQTSIWLGEPAPNGSQRFYQAARFDRSGLPLQTRVPLARLRRAIERLQAERKP